MQWCLTERKAPAGERTLVRGKVSSEENTQGYKRTDDYFHRVLTSA